MKPARQFFFLLRKSRFFCDYVYTYVYVYVDNGTLQYVEIHIQYSS